MVDVPIGKFSAMNTHPNAVSDLCNNKYNSNNSDLMHIIQIKGHELGTSYRDSKESFLLRVSNLKLMQWHDTSQRFVVCRPAVHR